MSDGPDQSPAPLPPSREPLGQRGAALWKLCTIPDEVRGHLTVVESGPLLPFLVRRVFYVYNVPDGPGRGEHAHRECHQMLICLHGSVKVMIDDGDFSTVVTLNDPSQGLHVPPMVWAAQYDHSPGAVLLVLASHTYDADDYIRDAEEFRRALKR